MEFTKWASGEPNDFTGSSNCVEMFKNTGEWNDHMCDSIREFVCQVKKSKTF